MWSVILTKGGFDHRRPTCQPAWAGIWAVLRATVVLLPLALLGVLAQIACADVQTVGNVFPARNPFNPVTSPGLPPSGNILQPGEEPNPNNPSAQNQTQFEGLEDITVGKTSSGLVLISDNTALRYQNLFIGDKGTVNGQVRLGTGTFRIDGFGALFNNDPTILPFGLDFATFGSKRSATTGFDVYVGRYGTGTLEISAGGRAEIQDALLVGDAAGAVGNVIVDGFDSYLGSGGFQSNGGGPSDIHMAIVGRQGIGVMTFSGGATINTEASPAGAGQNTVGPIGAVLGSTPYSFTEGQIPDPGGNGTVTVTGLATKWNIGGSLQIGGFDIGLDGVMIGSTEGDKVLYNSQVGRGTLNVNDGALVNIRNAIGVNPTDPTASLLLAIGRFGNVVLNGGTINLGSVTGATNEAKPDTIQVINDGVIRGSGLIATAVFRNRYLGQVRVDAGQSLVIDSSSQFSTAGGATPSEPLVNYGTIQVLGTADAPAQLEFIRAPGDATNPVRPLLNLPLSTQPAAPAFPGGFITAQNSVMRFGSGIQNQGVMQFTAGNNVVTGNVMNVGSAVIGSPDDADNGDGTRILITGPTTRVIFQNDVGTSLNADLALENGGNMVVQHNLALGGELSINLSYAHPSIITVGGNLGIGGGNAEVTLNFDSDVLHTLKHGDTFKIISFSGDIGGVDMTDPNNPVPDLTTAPLFTEIETSPDFALLYPALSISIQFANEGVYAIIANPGMVGGGAIAPDFNGDGVVDGADFAIWQAHFGIASGASVLDGDADGDGDVDGADFLKWQRNVGLPPPWFGPTPGAGFAGGAPDELGAVPEPATLAMLVAGGSLALAYSRRRFHR